MKPPDNTKRVKFGWFGTEGHGIVWRFLSSSEQVALSLWSNHGHTNVVITADEADELALALMAKATEARA